MEDGGTEVIPKSISAEENSLKEEEEVVMDDKSDDKPVETVDKPSSPLDMAVMDLTQSNEEPKQNEINSTKESEDTKENGVDATTEEKPLTPPTTVEEAKEASEITEENANNKKTSNDVEVEDQQSSTSSSPSALHIHLDEEDKDESLSGKEKESADPSLPLISNVVSLSSITSSSSSSLTPPPPTRSDQSPSTQPPSPTPSAESGNSVRRTTLRFKRGIEISFDVDQNGQPVSVNNRDAVPSASPGEPPQKRGRVVDDEDDDFSHPDVSELDAEGATAILSAVQKDIRTLRFMAKQKEKEWNYILKLMKVKEELQAKLIRRREVLKITMSPPKKELPAQLNTVAQTQIQQQQPGAASLQTLINNSLNAMINKSSSSVSKTSTSSIMNQQQQAKLNRQRPILPKPSMQMHPEMQMWSQQQHHHHYHHHHSSSSSSANHHSHVVDSVVGDSQADARNRQGTISVQSLIADYRAKHPEEIPTRGRRIRQPSRICNDPNSSSSPPPNSNGPEAANMSFKDVLLQFAKMSSRQGHPNPVDMIQVGKESPGTSGNSSMVAAGSSNGANSSAAALQSLAAARNARSSPHTAGSILQNALSGGRTNPNFAPTLAQLLTNPANEQPQQHPQQQQPSMSSSSQPVVPIPTSVATAASNSSSSAAMAAAAAAASAEVLTLSNLLATARGHVTITSDRSEHSSDDVTVVGGSTSGRNATSSNGNYMRTSGGSEVPKCQGCNERVAQFVCAGCSSQWYCSRECQVAAWEEHSEHCVG